jgi:transposase
MPRKTNYERNEIELSQLKEAIRKDARPEVRQRATAIHLLHLGYKPEEVSAQLLVSKPSIYNWHRRYQEGGLEGLANQPKGHPKRKADAAYCQEVETALAQDPSELGYSFAVWSVERLRDHLEGETGVKLSVSRLRVIMHQNDYVYRRPKHDLTALQDPIAKEHARELLEELKKGPAEKTKWGSSLWTKPS